MEIFCEKWFIYEQKHVKGTAIRSREKSMQYSINSEVVCETKLLNTLWETEKSVRTVFKKSAYGFTILPEMRVKHANRAFDAETIDAVKDHIISIPVVESHYIREGTKWQYLSPKLNVALMYWLYLETRPTIIVGLQS